MKILRVLMILLALAWAGSVHARCYLPDQVVPFDGYFHDDTGTLTDPSSPAAVLRITPLAGTAAYSALSAPAQINSETGRYGGEYTIPSSPTYGTYEISVKGDVPTSKTTGKVVTTFIVAASCPATASAIAALPTAAENRAEMDSNSAQLAAIVEDTNSLCPMPGLHFTVAGTPTATEFDTTGLVSMPTGSLIGHGLAWVWIQYADGGVEGGRITAFSDTNDHITLSTALTQGAPQAGDEGCLSIGINPQ